VRVSESAALDVEDVWLTARTGEVVVREAKRKADARGLAATAFG